MAVPTTNVGFDSIQTEFGGANPLAMNNYYAGGANVPTGTQSPVDPSPVPSSGAITFGEFRGCTKTTFPINPGGASVFQSNGPSFTTNCHLTFNGNGTMSHGGGGGATTTFYSGPANWVLPSPPTASYQIIVDSLTSVIGSPSGPTTGVWSGFSATFSASSGPGQACSGTFACRIRDATSLVVVASFNIQVDTDNT